MLASGFETADDIFSFLFLLALICSYMIITGIVLLRHGFAYRPVQWVYVPGLGSGTCCDPVGSLTGGAAGSSVPLRTGRI